MISLPLAKGKVGVFISGGIDSAVLYYLVHKENRRLGNLHQVVPLVVKRKEGSRYFAPLVIAYVNSLFGLDYNEPIYVGNPNLPEGDQVKSGVREALRLQFYQVYIGVIDQLPEHTIGWTQSFGHEDYFYKIPFVNLKKDQILKLAIDNNIEPLFHITHGCVNKEIGRCGDCNGCNERRWGFSQLGLTDPGHM